MFGAFSGCLRYERGGAAGVSPQKSEAFLNFRGAKIWLRPCGWAVMGVGAIFPNGAAEAN